MNGTDKHYDFLDIIRLIASIFVLLIHCPIDGMTGGYITAIGRFAVPFFILVSGFFSDYSDNDNASDCRVNICSAHLYTTESIGCLYDSSFYLDSFSFRDGQKIY